MRKSKKSIWNNRETEKTVYTIEIEHATDAVKAALRVLLEEGDMGSNIKSIKVLDYT
jgi:hypothetical protein|tara:strand:- start:448 stop:618 length:171 start_codon:yes stop_codon:yes gene_type:complete